MMFLFISDGKVPNATSSSLKVEKKFSIWRKSPRSSVGMMLWLTGFGRGVSENSKSSL
jgi:hypothetical protein